MRIIDFVPDQASDHVTRLVGRRIEGLDTLRFAAALAVLCYHYYFLGPIEHFMPAIQPSAAAGFGHFGVDAFFVISGFVISFSSDGMAASAFLMRRFLRLMPAFLICSIVSATLIEIGQLQSPATLLTLWLASLTFLPRLFGMGYLDGVYWTLAVEMTFYLWVGFLLATGAWRRYRLPVVTGWLLLAILNAALTHSRTIDKIFALTFAGHFAAGIVLHAVLYGGARRAWLLLLLPSLALMSRTALIGAARAEPAIHLGPAWLIGTAPWLATLLVVVAIRLPPLVPAAWSSLLGRTSYPLYLLHASLGGATAAFLAGRTGLVAAETLTPLTIVAISAAVAVYLEPPVKRLLRALPTCFSASRTIAFSPDRRQSSVDYELSGESR